MLSILIPTLSTFIFSQLFSVLLVFVRVELLKQTDKQTQHLWSFLVWASGPSPHICRQHPASLQPSYWQPSCWRWLSSWSPPHLKAYYTCTRLSCALLIIHPSFPTNTPAGSVLHWHIHLHSSPQAIMLILPGVLLNHLLHHRASPMSHPPPTPCTHTLSLTPSENLRTRWTHI